MGGTWAHEGRGSLSHTSDTAKNGICRASKPFFNLPYTYYYEIILALCSSRQRAFFEHYFSLSVQCIFVQRCTHGRGDMFAILAGRKVRHKGSRTISVSGNRDCVSVSGKIGYGVPEGIILRRPAPSIFTEKKIRFGTAHLSIAFTMRSRESCLLRMRSTASRTSTMRISSVVGLKSDSCERIAALTLSARFSTSSR